MPRIDWWSGGEQVPSDIQVQFGGYAAKWPQFDLFLQRNWATVISLFPTREVLAVGNYSDRRGAEDYELNVRLAAKGVPFLQAQEFTYVYRRRAPGEAMPIGHLGYCETCQSVFTDFLNHWFTHDCKRVRQRLVRRVRLESLLAFIVPMRWQGLFFPRVCPQSG